MRRLKVNLSLFEVFRQNFGHYRIPPNYIVPSSFVWPSKFHHFELGHYAQSIRSKLRNNTNEMDVHDVDTLLQYGFHVGNAKYKPQFVLSLLQQYKSLQHNSDKLMMSIEYLTPDDSTYWSEMSSNIPLGQLLWNIMFKGDFPTIHQDLLELGYTINSIDTPIDIEKTILALNAYKALHNNVNVPVNFVVPLQYSRFPEETWGFKLGEVVHAISVFGIHSEYDTALTQAGLRVVPLNNISTLVAMKSSHSYINTINASATLVLDVLRQYKEIYGDVNVVDKFCVPIDDNRYPHAARGMMLGMIVDQIRHNHYFSEYKTAFEEVGLVFPSYTKHYFTFESKYAALSAFKSIHGHVNVHRTFIVPYNDGVYPEQTWGMKLGQTVRTLRSQLIDSESTLTAVQKQQLVDIGLSIRSSIKSKISKQMNIPQIKVESSDSVIKSVDTSSTLFTLSDAIRRQDRVYEGILAYQSIHNNTNISYRYIIDRNDLRYPVHLRGFRLGYFMYNMVNKSEYMYLAERLKNAGIVVESVRHFSTVETALLVYKSIYHTVDMPIDYVIPSDSRYPTELHGQPLGMYMDKICHSEMLSSAKHQQQFRDMGVVIGTKMLDFQTIYDAIVVYQKLHGNVNIPTDFVVPTNVNNAEQQQNVTSTTSNSSYSRSGNDSTENSTKTVSGINYPTLSRGRRLGLMLREITHYGAYSEHRAVFVQLGIKYRGVSVKDFSRIRIALLAYKAIHNDLLVPRIFVVPSGQSEEYPEETWGLSLGTVVSKIRNHQLFTEHREELLSMGFVYKECTTVDEVM